MSQASEWARKFCRTRAQCAARMRLADRRERDAPAKSARAEFVKVTRRFAERAWACNSVQGAVEYRPTGGSPFHDHRRPPALGALSPRFAVPPRLGPDPRQRRRQRAVAYGMARRGARP